MFRIARTAKQIFRSARNIGKYCSQSKGCVDASEEFAFESFTKILPQQSVTKDHFRATAPIFQETKKLGSVGSYKILDSAEIRKLIYARFASEIVAKSKDAEGSKNFETKSHDTKEHIETFATYDIANEFNDLRNQGYDFAATREVLQNRNQDTNQSAKSIFERMKEISISGYLSNYSGDPQLGEDIEKVILQKDLVIKEFMERVNERVGFISVDNESFTDVTMTDLLGEY